MDELTQTFRAMLGQKRFQELERIWLELLGAATPLDELLDLVRLVERWHPDRSKPMLLLWVLSDALKEQGRFHDQKSVLLRLAEMSPEDPRLVPELVAYYRSAFAEVAQLDRLLQKSGLGYGKPLRSSLADLDRYLALVPGSWLLHRDQGPGRVEELDLLLGRATIRFPNGSRLVIGTSSLPEGIHPTAIQGFYWQLEHNPQAIADLLKKNPAEVAVMYLRDIGRSASPAEIGQGLSGLVSVDTWDGFWTAVRPKLLAHPHVAVHSRPKRTFEWSKKPVPKRRPSAEKGRGRGPTQELDKALDDMTEDELVRHYQGLAAPPQRRRFLVSLHAARPDVWPTVAVRIFELCHDRQSRTIVEKKLVEEHPEVWRFLLQKTLTDYRQNPAAFLWLAENATRLKTTPAQAIVTRVVDLVESTAHRSYWNRLRSILLRDNHRLADSALRQLNEKAAHVLLTRIRKARGFDQYHRDEIEKCIVASFPALAATKPAASILSTAPAIERAQQELQRLVGEEVPRSAEELARARAHGDLSENYEYKAAKEKQGRLMNRIKRLRSDLSLATPISASDVDTSEVSVGCRVELDYGRGDPVTYTILGPWDSNPDQGVVSYLAPLGQRLLGKKVGDTVEVAGRRAVVRRIDLGLSPQ